MSPTATLSLTALQPSGESCPSPTATDSDIDSDTEAIPPEPALLAAARRLIDSTSTWKQGKTYYGSVKTFHSNDSGDSWHCRLSTHTSDEATFDQMWARLGRDKAANEMAYVPEIKDAKEESSLSPTANIWTMRYAFPWPVSPRIFTVLQVVHLDEEGGAGARQGMIVSIPIDLGGSKAAGAVRGRYVSVETLRELEEDGVRKTEWRMATASTPGGMIPTFMAEAAMPGKIAEDVPLFMKWLRSLPE